MKEAHECIQTRLPTWKRLLASKFSPLKSSIEAKTMKDSITLNLRIKLHGKKNKLERYLRFDFRGVNNSSTAIDFYFEEIVKSFEYEMREIGIERVMNGRLKKKGL